MLLHSLTIEAFGSYVGPTIIDFDAVGASGLFLLEGPTGSGKSTILDAITFALYGNVEGRKVVNSRIQSDFVDEDVVPRVTLEFSAGGSRWHITRTAKRAEVGDDGLTTTKENATAVLKKRVGDRWEGQTDKAHEASVMIQTLLRLDRNQFTQLVLLPQGEFARFLRSGEDERRAILSDIFQATLYDDITDEIKDWAEKGRSEMRGLDDAKRVALSAALALAGIDEERREAALKLSGQPLSDELQQIEIGLEAVASSSATALDEARAAEKAIAEQLEIARTLHALVVRRDGAKRVFADFAHGRSEHEAKATRVEAARSASVLVPLHKRFVALQDRVQSLQERLPEADEGEDLPLGSQEMSEVRDKLLGLRAGLEAIVSIETKLHDKRAELNRISDKAQAEKDRESAGHSTLASLADRKDLERQRAAAEALAGEVVELESQERLLNDLIHLNPKIEAAESAVESASKEVERMEADLEALQDQHRSDLVAVLRAGLTEGQPCPVCGCCDHPVEFTTSESQVTTDDITRARSALSDARGELDRLKDEKSALDVKFEGLRIQVKGVLEPWPIMLSKVTGRLQVARQASESVSNLDEQLRQLSEQERLAKEQIQEAGVAYAGFNGEIEQLRVQIASDEESVREHRADFPTVQAHLEDVEQRLGAVEARLAYVSAVDESVKVETMLATMAREQGFADYPSAAAAILDASDLERLSGEVDAWLVEHGRLQAAAFDPEFDAIEEATVDDVAARIASLDRENDSAAERHSKAAARHTTAQNAVRNFSKACQGVQAAIQTLEEKRLQVEPIDHLDKMFRGMLGTRPMALTSFVLRLWFDRVVEAANLRLERMSQGQYTLVRTESVARKKGERTGLGLAVLDNYTGKRRIARSLSGGETFYASVALALGMVDVVQSEAGGAELNTLFIDEGFGTLDSKTRDMVMEVIEDLRESGRVIGIVSHVDELKDRIPEKIVVSREDDGPSQVTLVC